MHKWRKKQTTTDPTNLEELLVYTTLSQSLDQQDDFAWDAVPDKNSVGVGSFLDLLKVAWDDLKIIFPGDFGLELFRHICMWWRFLELFCLEW